MHPHQRKKYPHTNSQSLAALTKKRLHANYKLLPIDLLSARQYEDSHLENMGHHYSLHTSHHLQAAGSEKTVYYQALPEKDTESSDAPMQTNNETFPDNYTPLAA